MQKRWTIKKANDEQIEKLHEGLKIKKSLCKILTLRGITNIEEAEQYFRPKLENIPDPFLMKGMQAAVERVIKALNKKEKILIYGDYDVDGTSAVAVVFSFLKKYTSNVDYYIPNRFTEGYGVSNAGIEFAKANNFNLIITLDCGIKSISQVDLANTYGIDTIICDHHLPDENIPNALAILNPKQDDCQYPYKELCGCGIGYKLICAIEKTIEDSNDISNSYLDIVATAIAADIVPITGENRILAYFGLQKANSNPSFAIQALKLVSDFKNEFKINDLVFIVAPRINAAGRMDDAKKAVQLFIANSLIEAENIAKEININNSDRKEIDIATTDEALALLQNEPQSFKSTILYQSHWHKGVVGIVASRMIEHKFQPTIILTQSEGKVTGSARSIPGLNLFEALNQCNEHLETYGGHYFAAGLTLREENLNAFKNKFDEVVKNTLKEEDFVPQIFIDAEINFDEINEKYFSIIEQMEPYGPENLRPIFIAKNVKDYNGYSNIVKDKHLKYQLIQNGKVMKGIGFNQAHYIDKVKQGSFDVVFTLDKNFWNNTTTIEIKVIDIQ